MSMSATSAGTCGGGENAGGGSDGGGDGTVLGEAASSEIVLALYQSPNPVANAMQCGNFVIDTALQSESCSIAAAGTSSSSAFPEEICFKEVRWANPTYPYGLVGEGTALSGPTTGVPSVCDCIIGGNSVGAAFVTYDSSTTTCTTFSGEVKGLCVLLRRRRHTMYRLSAFSAVYI